MSVVPDIDPDESQEWIEAFESVLEYEGPERAHYLLEKLIDKARRSGVYFPHSANTAYINTIPFALEERSPGNHELEHRIRSYVRWNALAMVVHANKTHLELGGHIASFASAATLYDVGFDHFWHAPSDNHGGDLIYIQGQGHSAPGIYARVSRRAADRRSAPQIETGSGRQGTVFVSASLAHARILAVSDGLDGSRADHGDLSGALHEVP